MKKNPTNLEMLLWGIEHIAQNHGFECNTDYTETGSVFIRGNNVPTLSDVQMLCEDCKLDKDDFIETHEWGAIEVFLPFDYFDGLRGWGDVKYEKPPHEFWRRMC